MSFEVSRKKGKVGNLFGNPTAVYCCTADCGALQYAVYAGYLIIIALDIRRCAVTSFNVDFDSYRTGTNMLCDISCRRAKQIM